MPQSLFSVSYTALTEIFLPLPVFACQGAGELQGALTSLVSITAVVGPIVMTWLFAYFTGEKAPVHFSAVPFIPGAVLTLLSARLAYRNLHIKKKQL